MQDGRSAPAESYRLGRRLTSGSTGDVYEAAHPRLPGRYAIKILRPILAQSAEAVLMFRTEVEAVSALRHPNIVHVI